MNWLSEAGCKNKRTSAFFEDFEKADVNQRLKTLALCADCNVRSECESYADSFKNTYGIWGGYYYTNGHKNNPLKIKRPSGAKKITASSVLA
jgi:hypothetical protein